MDLVEAMRHMPGCRDYDTAPVSDEVLYRVLDNAIRTEWWQQAGLESRRDSR